MAKKEIKKTEVKVVNAKDKKESSKVEKKGLWTRFMIFCHGVGAESKKVHWPTKKDMVKYSVATIIFIIFCSTFFYLIEIIFALVHSLFN